MKVIIAGSRSIESLRAVHKAVAASGFTVTEVVSGCARGVDETAGIWARGHSVPIKRFLADWKSHGKAAGPIRNRQMAEYAEALIAIWDGKSRGTKNMIDTARELGLKVYVHEVTA